MYIYIYIYIYITSSEMYYRPALKAEWSNAL